MISVFNFTRLWPSVATLAVMGMILFHEPATVARIVCILLVVSGIVGLVVLEGQHGA